jgi:hypothetical protein
VSALLELDVERDGEDAVRVPVKMRTVVAWEKAFRGRALALLDKDRLRAEYLMELGWIAAGQPGTFDEFCATTDVTPVEDADVEDEPPDPTRPVPSTGS